MTLYLGSGLMEGHGDRFVDPKINFKVKSSVAVLNNINLVLGVGALRSKK